MSVTLMASRHFCFLAGGSIECSDEFGAKVKVLMIFICVDSVEVIFVWLGQSVKIDWVKFKDTIQVKQIEILISYDAIMHKAINEI